MEKGKRQEISCLPCVQKKTIINFLPEFYFNPKNLVETTIKDMEKSQPTLRQIVLWEAFSSSLDVSNFLLGSCSVVRILEEEAQKQGFLA